jgi:ATP-dependent Clp protease ATP-binding subunit ClpA
MFERFSKFARRVVLTAVTTAADAGADAATPEHLLLALADEDEGLGARVLAGHGITAEILRRAVAGAPDGTGGRAGLTDDEITALRSVGIDADEVFRRIEEAFGPEALDEPAGPTGPTEPAGPRRGRRRGLLGHPLDRAARKVLELSLREAVALGSRQIGTEHLLLGLLRQGLTGPIAAVLADRGVTYADVRQRVRDERDNAA